jgi:hypothetical protein
MRHYCLLLLLSAIFSLTACTEEDFTPFTYSSEATIYSQSGEQTRLRELLLVIKPYLLIEGEKKYIVTDSLYNVAISINLKPWGQFFSLPKDPELYSSEPLNSYQVTAAQVKYGVLAPYRSDNDTLTTAGEYAQLLNNFILLEPGFYFCEVESFDIKDVNGNRKTVRTSILETVEIQANSRSAFIGEFEVLVN